MVDRNKEWLTIWERKYQAFDSSTDTHVLDGYDGMSLEEWQKMVHFFLGKININATDKVLEVGCGAGAFVKEIESCQEICGIDYSDSAITAINEILNGNFIKAEANAIPFPDNYFDKILSFAVFFYFDSYEYAQAAFEEMVRVVKPGGTIFIGDINDLGKKELAIELRGESSQQRKSKYLSKKEVGHLYFDKAFFESLAKEHGLSITFIDQDQDLDFYYNAPYRYSILLTT